MGYDLHITRRKDWSESPQEDIPLSEWLAYINSDKELELTKEVDIKAGTEAQFQNRSGYCEWNAHPTERTLHSRPWFSYGRGFITTKNPDVPTIRKMLSIASALGATVLGDEGEVYDEKTVSQLEKPAKKQWWKFWQ